MGESGTLVSSYAYYSTFFWAPISVKTMVPALRKTFSKKYGPSGHYERIHIPDCDARMLDLDIAPRRKSHAE
jgi:hypothetical protein